MAGKGKGKGGGKREGGAKKLGGKKKGRMTKTQRRANWSNATNKLLKAIHKKKDARVGISKKGMAVVNSFVEDMFDRLASEAGNLARINGRQTLSSRDIQTAVRLRLPGELAKHAMSEGTKAVAKFTASHN